MGSKHWQDKELWDSLAITADRITSPEWHFGKYVDPIFPRDTLRLSHQGLRQLNERPDKRGRSHEKGSTVLPFVAWDGEGITYQPGTPQDYVLFGASSGHWVSGRTLTTQECLDCILAAERDNPAVIHVGFAFKYDAEMILSELTTRHWMVLRERSSVVWNGYLVTYHPGRIFRVSKGGVTATIYDVWGFFQGSFIKALQGWLDPSELGEIDAIEIGKGARGSFAYADLETFVKPYWQTELRLLVLLCDRLRERMVAADICPSEWHGAGALATRIYKKRSTRQHLSRTSIDWNPTDKDLMTELPEDVNHKARFAYAGGRFELFRLGHTDQKVYQYDINSAYPNAIARLPSLKHSEWRYVVDPKYDPRLFALWHVEYRRGDAASVYHPGPLPHRGWTGAVTFPNHVNGWYWTPEVSLVAGSKDCVITEAWICDHDDVYPFDWVAEMYAERKQRKAAGDPSEKALKLGLNSLYGKMAQRLGYKEGKGLPRFHQLEYAGFVTSFTRMMLYSAMIEAGQSLVAVETDAVFSLKPLTVSTGSGLGQWEVTEHEWITYLQSGTYWSDHGAKYRGFDKGSITHDTAMQWLQRCDWARPIVGTTTRFVGSGAGLGSPLHRTWLTDSRDMSPGRSGKRVHIPELCTQCNTGQSPAVALHPLICTARGGHTFPHALPWRDDEAPGLEWQEALEIDKWDHNGD